MLFMFGIVVPLAAQSTATGAQSPSLQLLSQSIWLAEEDELQLTFRVQNLADRTATPTPPPATLAGAGFTLDLITGVPARSRAAFQDRLIEPANNLIWQEITGLPLPEPDSNGVVTLRITTQRVFDFEQYNSNEFLLLPEEGVYPLSIILKSPAQKTVDSIHTFIVRLPSSDDVGTSLQISPVLSVGGPLAVSPQGELQLTQATQSFQALIDVLRPPNRATTQVTLVVEPHLVDALALSKQPSHVSLLNQMIQVTSNRPILSNTYVPIDSDAWIHQGLSLEIGWQIEAGARVLIDQLNNVPVPTTMLLTSSARPELLQRLKSEQLELVLVPNVLLDSSQQLATSFDRTSLYLSASNDVMRALVIGNPVSSVLSADLATTNAAADSANLGVDSLQMFSPFTELAALASHWFEDPQQKRAVALAFALRSPTDAANVGTFLDALAASPILETASPQNIADALPPSNLRRVLPRSENGFGEDYKAALNGGQQIARSYQNMVDPIATAGTPERELIEELERALLLSGTYGLSEIERDNYLAVVAKTIRDTVAAIEPPSPQRITITSRAENIPMLIRNYLDHDVIVALQLNSDKLDFPEGNLLLRQLSPGVNQFQAPVRAKTSGDAILEVKVNSPDGLLTLGESQITVRATSLSGVGVGIAAVALAILGIWWARHWRGRRAGSVAHN